jgi:predicted CopG family antitoxin
MSKLINVSDEIYKKLSSMKGDESFSIVINKLLEKRSNKEEILKFAGKIEFDEENLKDLKKGWKRWSEKYA